VNPWKFSPIEQRIGHLQRVVRILVACDEDNLLYEVEQEGVTCHTGHRFCFYRTLDGEEIAHMVLDPEKVYKKGINGGEQVFPLTGRSCRPKCLPKGGEKLISILLKDSSRISIIIYKTFLFFLADNLPKSEILRADSPDQRKYINSPIIFY
jgi:hypothetical protein